VKPALKQHGIFILVLGTGNNKRTATKKLRKCKNENRRRKRNQKPVNGIIYSILKTGQRRRSNLSTMEEHLFERDSQVSNSS